MQNLHKSAHKVYAFIVLFLDFLGNSIKICSFVKHKIFNYIYFVNPQSASPLSGIYPSTVIEMRCFLHNVSRRQVLRVHVYSIFTLPSKCTVQSQLFTFFFTWKTVKATHLFVWTEFLSKTNKTTDLQNRRVSTCVYVSALMQKSEIFIIK